MRVLVSRLLTASVLAAPSMPALAAASGSARLTDIEFSVVDLRPDDGIDAGYRFIEADGIHDGSRVSASVSLGGTDIGSSTVDSSPEGIASLNAHAAVPGAWAHASTSLEQLSVRAQTLRSDAHFNALAGTTTFAGTRATPPAEIVITPHTRIMLRATADVAVSVDAYRCTEVACESAFASTQMHLWSMWEDGDIVGRDLAYSSVGLDWDDLNQGRLQASRSSSFRLSVTNSSDDLMYVGHRATAWTFNPSATPPIPEPSTWALMLGGLGAVGAAARRRR